MLHGSYSVRVHSRRRVYLGFRVCAGVQGFLKGSTAHGAVDGHGFLAIRGFVEFTSAS